MNLNYYVLFVFGIGIFLIACGWWNDSFKWFCIGVIIVTTWCITWSVIKNNRMDCVISDEDLEKRAQSIWIMTKWATDNKFRENYIAIEYAKNKKIQQAIALYGYETIHFAVGLCKMKEITELAEDGLRHIRKMKWEGNL